MVLHHSPKASTEDWSQYSQDPVDVLGLSCNIRPHRVGCARTEGSEGIYKIWEMEETRWLTGPHGLHVLAVIKTSWDFSQSLIRVVDYQLNSVYWASLHFSNSSSELVTLNKTFIEVLFMVLTIILIIRKMNENFLQKKNPTYAIKACLLLQLLLVSSLLRC